MTQIDKVLEGLEDETKYIMVDGKPRTVKSVIDRILNEDKEEKRKLGTG